MVKFGSIETEAATDRRKLLLQKIQDDPALPALGSSVSHVVRIATSSHEAVQSLAHFILSDMALTQKILSVANTAGYRTASGAPVTTISKAIFLLGFDMVKTIALTMLLAEGLSGRSAAQVRQELVQAVGASLVGRRLARHSEFKDAEEAVVVGLFKNLGRLLVVMHDQASYDEIMALSSTGACSLLQATMQVLGCGFDRLADSMLRQWQIPTTIINALAPLPATTLKLAATRQDWLQQVACFSTEVAMLLSPNNQANLALMTHNLLARYGTAFSLDHQALQDLITSVAEETQILTNTICPLIVTEPASAPATMVEETSTGNALDAFLLLTAEPEMVQENEVKRHPSGKPLNASHFLLTGVQDASEMVASGRCKVNDLIMLVLETLSHGMGFRFATACIKDVKTQQFRARMSLGKDSELHQSGFIFPVTTGNNLFHLAMQNDVDVLISDAAQANVKALLPTWHMQLLPDAASFIVLPLIVKKQSFGLIYADRTVIATEGVSTEEATLIKMLKAQILVSLSMH
ncbi:MAG: HDOD domain-containing protein [Betaproteobacteria bacterium]|nr:HDOD domain-containing protein [Betaproteobacteria bacterium]